MKRMIIASTSTLHGGSYLDYLLPELSQLFSEKSVTFIPYARPGGISHDAYTNKVRSALAPLGIQVTGLHESDDPIQTLKESKGIFTGGGNTFVLVAQLYKLGLMDVLADVVKTGTPYLGCSAGSNITGLSMQTTNDMPIVYPPDFRTLGLIPYNLNPHYLDPNPDSTHMGETRETRIAEFHAYNTAPVIGLREGSWLEVIGNKITLKGKHTARLFRQGQPPAEVTSIQ